MATRTATAAVAAALLAAACASSDDAALLAADEPGGEPVVTVTPTTALTTASITAPTTSTVASIPSTTDDPRLADHDGPRALEEPLHPSFPDPLIELELIVSGGPPPDGIPPIDEPRYSTVDAAGFLRPTEPVIALEYDGEVIGFPIQIMTWHEIVNTEVGGQPVSVTFCPLCNSATAFLRTLPDGSVLDFGTSGLLFNSSLLMYDRQTGSLWTHFDGRAVVGAAVGVELERIPLQMVSWATFSETFPDALVLNRATGHQRPYGQNPYGGYDTVETSPFAFVGEIDGRLAAKTRVVAVRGEETLAVVTDDLAEHGVVHEVLDGRPIVVFHRPGTASALDSRVISEGRDVGATGVFVAEIDGRAARFAATGEGTFVDDVTVSTWDVFGRAVDGPATGSRLAPLEHLDTFWFAIAAFSPEARIVAG